MYTFFRVLSAFYLVHFQRPLPILCCIKNVQNNMKIIHDAIKNFISTILFSGNCYFSVLERRKLVLRLSENSENENDFKIYLNLNSQIQFGND